MLAFPESPFICPVLSLRDYLVRTAPLCHTDAIKMFIQLRKPHKSVSPQSLARWTSDIMAAAGVDTSMFKQHSTHSASAARLEKGTKTMSVAQICRHAQWSNLNTTYKTAVEILWVGWVEVGSGINQHNSWLKSQSGNSWVKIPLYFLLTQEFFMLFSSKRWDYSLWGK